MLFVYFVICAQAHSFLLNTLIFVVGTIFWQAGVSVVRFDGCTQCNLHVWHEKEKSDVCPICKDQGEEQIRTRYDTLVNKLTY